MSNTSPITVLFVNIYHCNDNIAKEFVLQMPYSPGTVKVIPREMLVISEEEKN